MNGNGQQTGAIVRDGGGNQVMQHTGETASTAIAAREQAWIQSRIVQAMKCPRTFEKVREAFKADCDRPRFALVARFAKPQGWVTDPETNKYVTDDDGNKIRNYVRGWSIRAIESAVRAMGNMDMTATTVFEDDTKEVVECRVWDLERNDSQTASIVIPKTVERKFIKKGQKPLSVRDNSYGDPVYLLPATDDEVRMSRNRLVSMTLRTLGQRLIPGDLLDEFLEPVETLRAKAIADEKAGVLKDPKAAMRALLDKLAALGIKAADVVEYLGGRSIDSATPDMILELRIIGADVTAGNYTWRDAVEGSPYRERDKTAEGDLAAEDKKAAEARAKIEARLAQTKAKAEAKKPVAEAQPTPPTAKKPAPDRTSDRGEGALTPEQEREVFGREPGEE